MIIFIIEIQTASFLMLSFLLFFVVAGPVEELFSGCHSPGQYFTTFFDNSIVDDLIFQTTLYITQQECRVSTVTRQDILGFIGINIIMGYHVLPSYTHYWCEGPDVSVPFISSVLTRNRFSQILSNVHVNDNKNLDKNDKLSKIRPLIAKANSQFAKLYDVRRVQSVDESMVLFKGRSSIKQYCPMKPIKRGYKLWVIADMDGYISKFDVYQGKNGKENQKWNGFGLGESVLCEMVEDLFDGGMRCTLITFLILCPSWTFSKRKRYMHVVPFAATGKVSPCL